MQDRIREILQEQIAMKGGYGTHVGAVKAAKTRKREIMEELGMGDMANRRAARRSPWISFLKDVEQNMGIPYNEAMVDPEIRHLYYESGAGTMVGGKGTAAGARKNPWDQFLKQNSYSVLEGVKHKKAYQAFKKKFKPAIKKKPVTKRKPATKRKLAVKSVTKRKVSQKKPVKNLRSIKGLSQYTKPQLKQLLMACLGREGSI